MLQTEHGIDLTSIARHWFTNGVLNASSSIGGLSNDQCGTLSDYRRQSDLGADTFGAPLNSAVVPALAAIAGSLVGAFGSATATWITARHQDRRNLLGQQIARRETLYSDFIGESARLLVDALQHSASDLQKLLPLYALLSRIRLSSSETVLEEAEKVIRTIISTYPRPNLTAEQIESEAENGKDPLREFSDRCRIELDSLQQQL